MFYNGNAYPKNSLQNYKNNFKYQEYEYKTFTNYAENAR